MTTIRSTRHDYGDGDACPGNDTHGKMYVHGTRQWCPHSDHAGIPGSKGTPPTRSWWPLYMKGASEWADVPAKSTTTDVPMDVVGSASTQVEPPTHERTGI